MCSNIFQNEDIFHNNKEFQKRNNLKYNWNKAPTNIENNDSLKIRALYNKTSRENSMRNIKSFNINKLYNIIPKNELSKKESAVTNYENIKILKTKSILPLLNNDLKPSKKILLNQNSLINSCEIMNKNNNREKESYYKNLYLEYKKENNENRRNNEATYIEIDPHQIILALTEFSNVRQMMSNLTKKINQRNVKSKNKNNSDSRITIDDILNNLEKSRKNKTKKNINLDNSILFNKNNLYLSSSIFIQDMNYKNNYSIQDLFLLDIINKVIKKVIFFQDKTNQNIDEDFMLKEYRNQVKKLKIFFDEKINEKARINSLIGLSKEGNTNEISQVTLRQNFFNNELLNECIINKQKYKNDMNIDIFCDKNISQKTLEKNHNGIKRINILNKPKLKIYNFDIGPRINIIDFDELLIKIHRQRLDIKDDNSNINENILNKLMELNKKKIKFENHMIEEKTKILNNKNKSNIFMGKKNKYSLRNIYNSEFNKKKLNIRKELFKDNNKNIKDKSFDSFKKEIEDSFSSLNESYFRKIINKKETMKHPREKIIIEKLGIKKDFGLTKVSFNKTIDKIRRMHNNKTNKIRNKMYINNYSFLNTIYGKINSKRKIKINEIDYKEEIKQKGYQMLYNIFEQNPNLKLNKNLSAEDLLILNKEKKNEKGKEKEDKFKTLDKGTSTKGIKFKWNKKIF